VSHLNKLMVTKKEVLKNPNLYWSVRSTGKTTNLPLAWNMGAGLWHYVLSLCDLTISRLVMSAGELIA
jgi:hypothetical protein